MRLTLPAFRALAAAAAGAALAACGVDRLDAPNTNAPTIGGISSDPKTATQVYATGVIQDGRRTLVGLDPGFNVQVGILGRESYFYFSTDSRFVTDYLGSPSGGTTKLDRAGFASGLWGDYYNDLKTIQQLVATSSGAPQFSAQEKAAVSGFAKTFQAMDWMYLIATRDSVGIPVDVPANAQEPAPFVSRDSVYRLIVATLNSAAADLQGGGGAFPFTLPAGWSGFDTPATFLTFNRAMAARANVRFATLGCGASCFTAAIAAVNASFAPAFGSLPTQAALDAGPAYAFSSANNDVVNSLSPLGDANVVAHPSYQTDAETRADGTPDLRYQRKIELLDAPRTGAPGAGSIPTPLGFKIYPATSTPVPIIRAEELMLIRGESNLGLGDYASAAADLNAVRTVSGGLPPLTLTASDPASAWVDAMLYERRYSLMLEGHRWVDVRRYGRLDTLPLDQPFHFRAVVMPVPQAECLARANNAPDC